MTVVLLAVCSANVVAFLQGPASQADDATGAEGHADRPPSSDAPTSRSLLFAKVEPPKKMTYSSVVDGSGKPGWMGYTKPITKLFLVGYGDGPSKSCQDRYGELVSTADLNQGAGGRYIYCLLYTSPSPRDS